MSQNALMLSGNMISCGRLAAILGKLHAILFALKQV